MSNSVANTTEKYDDYKKMWTKCRDCIKGQEAVKKKRETYLPKLSGQDKDDYDKYVDQALFYNASGRTFQGYKGLVFRKEPDINADAIQEFVEDCDLAGTPLVEFAEEAVKEELKTSRFGVLVERPKQDEADMSEADAERRGFRPYLVGYKAEQILYVEASRVGNRTTITQVRLQETKQEPTEDEFEKEEIEQIRVLDLADGQYRQRVYRKSEKQWEQYGDDYFPKMNGQPIEEIPFYMVGGVEYREPHMLDLVNLNMAHYIKDADHSAGVARTTRPQFYGTGIKDDELPDQMTLGGGTFWNFPNPEAEVGILSLESDLTASSNYIQRIEERMAYIGAQFLMPTETEQTATEYVIKKQGENSSLSSVSKLVSDCLTKAIYFVGLWSGVPEESANELSIRLNRDFIPFTAKPDDVVKMIQAKQSGEYTGDDLLWWYKQNEIVDPSIPDEERKQKLQTEPPAEI